MKNLSIILVTLFAVACGDNLKPAGNPDGSTGSDGGGGFPVAPTLGVQIDRMARPAINTALNHAFDITAAAGTAKDAYNQDGSPGGWPAAYAPEFAKNLAILDSLDTGLSCVSGNCMAGATPAAGDGCGNQILFNETVPGGGTPTATSYITLAGILASDELYLDTNKGLCDLNMAPDFNHQNYLGVEFNYLTSTGGQTCGGREPHNDVMDTSYTALAVGLQGFSAGFTPAFKDGVGPHADLTATFPYLGPPHT